MSEWNIDAPTTEYFGPSKRVIQENPDAAWRDPYAAMEPGGADRFQALMNELPHYKEIAIDTETTGLNTWKDQPLYFSIAWGSRRATLHASMLAWFQPILQDPDRAWFMANAKYDMHILSNVTNIAPWINAHPAGTIYDTAVMHALLYSDAPHDLKSMCLQTLGWTWGSFEVQFGKIGKTQSASELIRKAELFDFDRLVEYAGNDAWGTLNLGIELRRQLQASPTHSLYRTKPPYIETLWDLFYKIEAPYTRVLWQMERHGVRVDRKKLEAARPEAEDYLKSLERKLTQLRGRPINVSSTTQLREWLIDERKLAPRKLSKGGKTGVRNASVDSGFLQHHADEGDEPCKLILEYRDYSKLLGTYITGLHELLDPNDRIHTRYNQAGARTGRLSSSSPNLH